MFPDLFKLVKSAGNASLLSEGTFTDVSLDSLLNLAQLSDVAADDDVSSPCHISGPGSVTAKAGVVSMLMSSKLAHPEVDNHT